MIDNILSRKIAHIGLRMPQGWKLPNYMLEGILYPYGIEFFRCLNYMQFKELLDNFIYLTASNCLWTSFTKLAAHFLSRTLQASKVVEADAWNWEFLGALDILDEQALGIGLLFEGVVYIDCVDAYTRLFGGLVLDMRTNKVPKELCCDFDLRDLTVHLLELFRLFGVGEAAWYAGLLEGPFLRRCWGIHIDCSKVTYCSTQTCSTKARGCSCVLQSEIQVWILFEIGLLNLYCLIGRRLCSFLCLWTSESQLLHFFLLFEYLLDLIFEVRFLTFWFCLRILGILYLLHDSSRIGWLWCLVQAFIIIIFVGVSDQAYSIVDRFRGNLEQSWLVPSNAEANWLRIHIVEFIILFLELIWWINSVQILLIVHLFIRNVVHSLGNHLALNRLTLGLFCPFLLFSMYRCLLKVVVQLFLFLLLVRNPMPEPRDIE